MTPQIAIHNRQRIVPIDIPWLSACLSQALIAEGVSAAEVEVSIVDDQEIHRINREFLGHDWATDVISFSYAEGDEVSDGGRWPCGQGLLLDGELIVSAETALRQASWHGWSPEHELLLYGVHGCLHLCGYDDLTDAERPLMRRRERELLAGFGLCPQNLEDGSAEGAEVRRSSP